MSLQINVDDISSGVTEAIKKGCLQIEADAKKACPVDTGNLRASIHTTIEEMEGEVGTPVEYAEFVEFGTKHQTAKPFLYPSLEKNKKKIIAEIEKAVKKSLGGK